MDSIKRPGGRRGTLRRAQTDTCPAVGGDQEVAGDTVDFAFKKGGERERARGRGVRERGKERLWQCLYKQV